MFLDPKRRWNLLQTCCHTHVSTLAPRKRGTETREETLRQEVTGHCLLSHGVDKIPDKSRLRKEERSSS